MITWDALLASVLGLAGGGAGVALLTRHKTDAEASLARAQVEDMTWDHAKHTIVQLQHQVEMLVKQSADFKSAMVTRENDMTALQVKQAECEAREKALIERLGRIEERIEKQEGTAL